MPERKQIIRIILRTNDKQVLKDMLALIKRIYSLHVQGEWN